MPEENSVFVSYRRSDSNHTIGRIYDRLADYFGSKAVFRDVHSIPLGVDFRSHLQQQLGQCQVLVAIIGSTWLTVADTAGNRRLDNPNDWVRAEIETALNRDIPVIPVLVGGATMPAAEALPGDIAPLAYRNGISARPDPDFHQDMNRLIHRLEEIVGEPPIDVLNLDHQQRAELKAALGDAFPDPDDLSEMLEDHLGHNWDNLSPRTATYPKRIRDVVVKLNAQSQSADLLRAAIRANPDNLKLQELATRWLKANQ